MKSYLLIAALLVCILPNITSVFAQGSTWDWAIQSEGTHRASGNAVALDGQGNSFVLGTFSGSAQFGSTTLTSRGKADVFLAKVSPTGSYLWAFRAGGDSSDLVSDITVDRNGNAYFTCYVIDNADFGMLNLLDTTHRARLSLAKVNGNGDVLWVKNSTIGTNADLPTVSTDFSGNVLVCGNTSGVTSLDGITLPRIQGSPFFIFKFDSTGTSLWANQYSNRSFPLVLDVCTSTSNAIFVCGIYYRDLFFPSDTLISQGINDVFILKIAENGTIDWVTSLVGPGDNIGSYVASDSLGNAYIAGTYTRRPSIDGIQLDSLGSNDLFLLKLTPQGQTVWVKSIGGPSYDIAESVAVNRLSEPVLGGLSGGSVDLGSGLAVLPGRHFVIQFNSLGIPANVNNMLNVGGLQLAVNSSSEISVAGTLNGPITLGNHSLATSGTDLFCAKLEHSLITGSATSRQNSLLAFPNPASGVLFIGKGTDVYVFDAMGKVVLRSGASETQRSLSITDLRPGVYVIRCGSQYQRLILE